MKKFIFCSKLSGEAISSHRANSIDDAIEFFAALKKMNKEQFLSVFKVLQV